MDNVNPQNQRTSMQTDSIARLEFLFSQIPDHIYVWLFSEQATENVLALAKKFNLSEFQVVQMSRLTGLTLLKELSLPQLTKELKNKLNLDDAITQQLAIDIALKQFLPARDHLLGVEDFIKQLGGSLPATLPPLAKASTSSAAAPIVAPAPAPTTISVIQKTLRQIAKDNKDSLNQPLTNAPIKIADFEQPVRPTIKNWLVDYVKTKGAGHHEPLERGDYLFSSLNTKQLSEEERSLVSKILKAYDDDLPLPVNAQDQTILLENIEKSAPTEPVPIPAIASGTPSGYREPIAKEDLIGPLKNQAQPKNTPRLSGNVIDLKDMQ